MLKILVAILLLVPTLAFAHSKIRTQMLDPTIEINNDCSSGAVTSHILVTAYHCVQKKLEGTIEFVKRDGMTIQSKLVVNYKVIAVDLDLDLAALELLDKDVILPTLTIAPKLLVEEGDQIWSVGYPMGTIRTITTGLFNGYDYFDDLPNAPSTIRKPWYAVSSNMYPGNSGGFTFQKNGDNYEGIGVMSQIRIDNPATGVQIAITHLSKLIPLEDIHKFLKKNNIPF